MLHNDEYRSGSTQPGGLASSGLADLECLVQRLRPDLLRFVDRLIGDPWAAEDVTQEVLIKLCRSPRLRCPGALQSWLFTVARHAAFDYLRDRRKRVVDRLPEEGSQPPESSITDGRTPYDAATTAETLRLVQAAVEVLPEQRRTALRLCVFRGLDQAAAAQVMNCPPATVNSRLARARQGLRLILSRSAFGAVALG